MLPPLLIDQTGRVISDFDGWIAQREKIRNRWLDYLGVLKPNPVSPVLSIITEESPEDLVRRYVSYEGEPGSTVYGYLIRPREVVKPMPGIVAMHSTSDNQMAYIAGVEEGKIVDFGFQLAKRGFVVFCPQCFLWHDKGERDYEQQVEGFHEKHPGSKGMAKMLFDAQRAVDVLESLKEVDPNRIGAVGHSLGAKETLYLAAFDGRIKAAVSNEGGIGIDFSNWDASWYLGQDIHEFGHRHHEVLSLIAPRPFFLIGGDSADGIQSEPYIDAVLPVYRLYGNDKKDNIEFWNHGQGHGVTPQAEARTYEWLIRHLMTAG